MDFLKLIQMFSQLGGKDAANSKTQLPLPGANFVPQLRPGNSASSSSMPSKGILGMGGTDTGIMQKGMNMFNQFNSQQGAPINIDPMQKKNPLQGLMSLFGG
jgi:hypothetical protein